LGGVLSATDRDRGTPPSAAAPSPFTPIADSAFLSNCDTGALIAPDGAVDWLCVPRFDAPSVFGALLDRRAGSFRLGPLGVDVPATRAYEPGTKRSRIWRLIEAAARLIAAEQVDPDTR
jgi:alpha,alpha-trehalase